MYTNQDKDIGNVGIINEEDFVEIPLERIKNNFFDLMDRTVYYAPEGLGSQKYMLQKLESMNETLVQISKSGNKNKKKIEEYWLALLYDLEALSRSTRLILAMNENEKDFPKLQKPKSSYINLVGSPNKISAEDLPSEIKIEYEKNENILRVITPLFSNAELSKSYHLYRVLNTVMIEFGKKNPSVAINFQRPFVTITRRHITQSIHKCWVTKVADCSNYECSNVLDMIFYGIGVSDNFENTSYISTVTIDEKNFVEIIICEKKTLEKHLEWLTSDV